MRANDPAIGVLTFNCESSLAATLAAARKVSTAIAVLDSYSTDKTLEIARSFGAVIHQRAFTSYTDQRNSLIDLLSQQSRWQLHLDADEEMDDTLVSAIKALTLTDAEVDAYLMRRDVVFLGKQLRWGGASSVHCRLFRSGTVRVEQRAYDQHFLPPARTQLLPGAMRDHQAISLTDWSHKHVKWAQVEALEAASSHVGSQPEGQVAPKAAGNAIERRRYLRKLYYACPPLLRGFGYVVWRLIVQLGFLDGKAGIIYHVLQGFWFRFLVDALVYEKYRGKPYHQPPQAHGVGHPLAK
ncbi:MAG: glycosyltransferase family 2 protein [Pseudomonadota bacterium]